MVLLVVCCGLAGTVAAQTPAKSLTGRKVACTNGSASAFSCSAVDLSAFLTAGDIGGLSPFTSLNDIWGWTDPQTGREYALVGRTDGLAFVDVSDPVNPIYVGSLASHDGIASLWRDMKVYADHVFVVVDAVGAHGMQVFDLTQLRAVTNPPVTFVETAHYAGVGTAHNTKDVVA